MLASPERIAHLTNGIDLCYDTFGDPADPTLLLVMGLSGPLIWWDQELCGLLVQHGLHVVRFDNRDIGHSTVVDARPPGQLDIVRGYLRPSSIEAPYGMSDLARDAAGLLDHLGVGAAHILGVSMGGMIAQTLAVECPDRVLSLTSVMSTTGSRRVGWPDPRLLSLLVKGGASDEASFVEQSVRVARVIGSRTFGLDEDMERALAAATYRRGISPEGVVRQMLAVLTQPDRTAALRGVRVPTAVVHGTADKMVHVSGGRATAAAVPGARLTIVPGMGHDLPRRVWPVLIGELIRVVDPARG